MIKTRKTRVSQTVSIPAPVGGLNARDAIADMDPKDAVIMRNWFPSTASVDIRNGYASHSTGFAAPIETLISYSSGTNRKLFACAGTAIYDATASGAVGAAVVSALTNARFQYIQMGTVGGNFILAVNGADKMRVYTGSTWYADGTTTTVTGFDTINAIHINNFKNRVWLIQKDSLLAWYLPVSSIGGAANSLDFSGIFKLGGSLAAMANWTIDNAAGIDDYAAFISTEGEVAIYQGTDPSSSTTWALKGTFRVGRPIGRRCTMKAGADVLLLTTDGAFPLSKALLTDRAQMQNAVTDKITNLITVDIAQYGSNFGWQPIIHPIGNKMFINVPIIEGQEAKQYVMNTITSAWCEFTGWNAICFEISDDVLYFGGINTVYTCDVDEADDNGSQIVADVQQAFNSFGNKTAQKHFKMFRPIFLSDVNIIPATRINVDYETLDIFNTSYSTISGDSIWDVAPWDTSDWARGDVIIKNWMGASALGYSAGLRVKISSSGVNVKWQASDILFEQGGVL